jgi:hypothetical protein
MGCEGVNRVAWGVKPIFDQMEKILSADYDGPTANKMKYPSRT